MVKDRGKHIRRNKPIELYGLTFYPIKMDEYETFTSCRGAITLMQQTLPVSYVAMTFLEALYAFDYDRVENGEEPVGLFARLLVMLSLATGISAQSIQLRVEAENHGKLVSVELQQGEMLAHINGRQFVEIRKLIAEQNGLELPDEADNAELVQAEKDLADQQIANIEYDADTMIASVAYQAGIRVPELYEWTIREFENLRKAIDRDKHFAIYASAELTGAVKFPKGNPYPSWCFDKKRDSAALISAAEWQGKMGNAIQTTNSLPNAPN